MNAGKHEFPHLQFIAGQLEKRLTTRKLVEITMKAAAECEEQAALASYHRKEVGLSCRAYYLPTTHNAICLRGLSWQDNQRTTL